MTTEEKIDAFGHDNPFIFYTMWTSRPHMNTYAKNLTTSQQNQKDTWNDPSYCEPPKTRKPKLIVFNAQSINESLTSSDITSFPMLPKASISPKSNKTKTTSTTKSNSYTTQTHSTRPDLDGLKNQSLTLMEKIVNINKKLATQDSMTELILQKITSNERLYERQQKLTKRNNEIIMTVMKSIAIGTGCPAETIALIDNVLSGDNFPSTSNKRMHDDINPQNVTLSAESDPMTSDNIIVETQMDVALSTLQ